MTNTKTALVLSQWCKKSKSKHQQSLIAISNHKAIRCGQVSIFKSNVYWFPWLWNYFNFWRVKNINDLLTQYCFYFICYLSITSQPLQQCNDIIHGWSLSRIVLNTSDDQILQLWTGYHIYLPPSLSWSAIGEFPNEHFTQQDTEAENIQLLIKKL